MISIAPKDLSCLNFNFSNRSYMIGKSYFNCCVFCDQQAIHYKREPLLNDLSNDIRKIFIEPTLIKLGQGNLLDGDEKLKG